MLFLSNNAFFPGFYFGDILVSDWFLPEWLTDNVLGLALRLAFYRCQAWSVISNDLYEISNIAFPSRSFTFLLSSDWYCRFPEHPGSPARETSLSNRIEEWPVRFIGMALRSNLCTNWPDKLVHSAFLAARSSTRRRSLRRKPPLRSSKLGRGAPCTVTSWTLRCFPCSSSRLRSDNAPRTRVLGC